MIALVLNMDKDKERLCHMAQQLSLTCPEFTRIPAINGRNMLQTELQSYGKNVRGNDWSNGALGCFLSHRSAWHTLVTSGEEYALILEDDVYLSADLSKLLQDISWIPKDADIVRLETSTNRVKLEPVGEIFDRHICKVRSTCWCCGAYLIHRDTAQTLLETPREKWDSVDYFLLSRETSEIARTLNVYQVTPALAVQAKFNSGYVEPHFLSNIEPHGIQKNQRSLLTKLAPKELLGRTKKVLGNYKRIDFR
ncbi:MAG TPA: glycosyltransferase family 25 protein [Alphaproteobacteria bacterium]|nr:glycosyltransferase family 25 protein [Alphaproteobacteria bacterium]HOO50500.1 glycosyltransferase family 25 protein [Alphaproteobacteria bacterium]